MVHSPHHTGKFCQMQNLGAITVPVRHGWRMRVSKGNWVCMSAWGSVHVCVHPSMCKTVCMMSLCMYVHIYAFIHTCMRMWYVCVHSGFADLDVMSFLWR